MRARGSARSAARRARQSITGQVLPRRPRDARPPSRPPALPGLVAPLPAGPGLPQPLPRVGVPRGAPPSPTPLGPPLPPAPTTTTSTSTTTHRCPNKSHVCCRPGRKDWNGEGRFISAALKFSFKLGFVVRLRAGSGAAIPTPGAELAARRPGPSVVAERADPPTHRGFACNSAVASQKTAPARPGRTHAAQHDGPRRWAERETRV